MRRDPTEIVEAVLRAEALAAEVPTDLATVPTIEALEAHRDTVKRAVGLLDAVLAALPEGDRIGQDEFFTAAAARGAVSGAPERFTRAAIAAAREACSARRQRVSRAIGERRAPDFFARSAALTDAVVEALRRPDTPAVVAARAAREEAEERRKERLLEEWHAEAARAADAVAWARVLAEPGSMAARRALLAAWATRTDAAKTILEGQLALDAHRRGGRLGSPEAQALYRSLNLAIHRDGHIAAGFVLPITKRFWFHRGLVAEVELSGERFVERAAALVEAAPVQHLVLTAPLGDLDRLFAVPELERFTSLTIHGLGEAFGDAGARALARSPRVARLRWIALTDCAIGLAGVEALAASRHLAGAAFVGLGGNPSDPTPQAQVYEGVAYTSRPPLAQALERRFGPRPWLAEPADAEDWPPGRDRLAVVDD